ncbi:MAG TPA: type II secretion system F family protein [Candidatus Dormibacteraeota bacterium]|nr:type II secretion system F family protein [Candidatus Dormibacteraeota bacterium]
MSGQFLYIARNSTGTKLDGTISALNRATAITELAQRGLTVTFIGAPGISTIARHPRLLFSSKFESERRELYRAFGTLLNAGCSFSKSFEICLARSRSARFREALSSIHSRVLAGDTLSNALKSRPREFPESDVTLIRIGEQSGSLDLRMIRLAEFLDKQRTQRSRLSGALAYPLTVLCFSLLTIIALAVTTMPALSALFQQLGVPVPAIVTILLEATALLRSPSAFLVGLLLVGATVGAVYLLSRSGSFHERCEVTLYKLPVIGRLRALQVIGTFASVASEMLAAGIDIIDAIRLGSEATRSMVMRSLARQWSEAILAGNTWSRSLSPTLPSDPLFVSLIAIGEESGSLDRMLSTIGLHHSEDLDAAITMISALVEPITMVILGLLIAVFVTTMLVPLYSAIGDIK